MGMYDSFYVEYQNDEYELQTKRFDNMLDHWRIGDVINQPSNGVNVFFEEQFWDYETKTIGYADDDVNNLVFYIVVANGVFVESEYSTELDTASVVHNIKQLEAKWDDPTVQNTLLVKELGKRQRSIAFYERQIARILGYIREYDNKDESSGKILRAFAQIHYPELENISSESDLLDVINDIADNSLATHDEIDDTEIDVLMTYRL